MNGRLLGTRILAGHRVRYEFRIRPKELQTIEADEDPMELLFSRGDWILIDIDRKIPDPPGSAVKRRGLP